MIQAVFKGSNHSENQRDIVDKSSARKSPHWIPKIIESSEKADLDFNCIIFHYGRQYNSTILFEVHNTAILRQMNNNMPMKYEPILHIFFESNFCKVVIVFTIRCRYNLILCCFIIILVNCE